MKKCLTILLCLCMVWTMTPLGVWAEPVVDNEAGTITVTTQEEMIAALNDAEGPDTIRVEQTINISKEEDGFRTVVIPAGKTLWLENADCLQLRSGNFTERPRRHLIGSLRSIGRGAVRVSVK